MYWLFTTEENASVAEQLILKLGSRALALRENYQRDAQNRVIGKRVSDGTASGAATEHWSPIQETSLGLYGIYSPSHSNLYANEFTDTPTTLAIGWGLDSSSVDWASVATAVGLNPLTFDPDVEVTLTGENWVIGAFAILGITYIEDDNPTFI